MRPLDINYIAGFFDSEGCIVIEEYKKKAGRLQPRIRVSNCHKAVPYLLKKYYGGCVCILKRKRKNPNWSDCYAWNIVGRMVLRFLKDVYPYVIVKKKQVDLGIKFYEDFVNLRRASDIIIEREVNRRKFIKERIAILNKTHGGD